MSGQYKQFLQYGLHVGSGAMALLSLLPEAEERVTGFGPVNQNV